MKKSIFTLCAIVCAMSMSAQTVKIYKDGQVKYESSKADSIVFIETIPVTETGLALVKKVYEQVSAPEALSMMNRSVYEFDYKIPDYYDTYIYKSSSDSIRIDVYQDSVWEATVHYMYPNNVIASTCLQHLENDFGSSIEVQGLTLDSTYATIITKKHQDWGGFLTPTTKYYLYNYQDIVDSIKADTKILDCEMWYHSRTESERSISPIGIFICEYDTIQNTTKLEMGYGHYDDE